MKFSQIRQDLDSSIQTNKVNTPLIVQNLLNVQPNHKMGADQDLEYILEYIQSNETLGLKDQAELVQVSHDNGIRDDQFWTFLEESLLKRIKIQPMNLFQVFKNLKINQNQSNFQKQTIIQIIDQGILLIKQFIKDRRLTVNNEKFVYDFNKNIFVVIHHYDHIMNPETEQEIKQVQSINQISIKFAQKYQIGSKNYSTQDQFINNQCMIAGVIIRQHGRQLTQDQFQKLYHRFDFNSKIANQATLVNSVLSRHFEALIIHKQKYEHLIQNKGMSILEFYEQLAINNKFPEDIKLYMYQLIITFSEYDIGSRQFWTMVVEQNAQDVLNNMRLNNFVYFSRIFRSSRIEPNALIYKIHEQKLLDLASKTTGIQEQIFIVLQSMSNVNNTQQLRYIKDNHQIQSLVSHHLEHFKELINDIIRTGENKYVSSDQLRIFKTCLKVFLTLTPYLVKDNFELQLSIFNCIRVISDKDSSIVLPEYQFIESLLQLNMLSDDLIVPLIKLLQTKILNLNYQPVQFAPNLARDLLYLSRSFQNLCTRKGVSIDYVSEINILKIEDIIRHTNIINSQLIQSKRNKQDFVVFDHYGFSSVVFNLAVHLKTDPNGIWEQIDVYVNQLMQIQEIDVQHGDPNQELLILIALTIRCSVIQDENLNKLKSILTEHIGKNKQFEVDQQFFQGIRTKIQMQGINLESLLDKYGLN